MGVGDVTKPKLSIIIPVYNTEKYLAACLDSVVGQSWDNLEVLIVDDCTPDHAMEIAEDYAERYPFIRILHHPENCGLFRTRITGMEAMTGDYFAFLDSDDTVTLDYYRPMIKKAMETGADMVAGDFIEVMESGEMYYPNRIFQQTDLDLKDREILNFLMRQSGQDYGCHVVWNKVYSRSLYTKIAPFLQSIDTPFTMCEDVLYSILLFGSATSLRNVHGEYYFYFRHAGAATSIQQVTVEKCKNVVHDIVTVFHYAEQYLTSLQVDQECYQGLKRWQLRLLKGWKGVLEHQVNGSHREKQAVLDQIEPIFSPEEWKKFRPQEIPFDSVKVNDLPLQEIKQAIRKSDCKYVSFDIFDTLLLRPFWYPTDLFTFMEPEVTKIIGTVDSIRFQGLRRDAEYLARQYAIGSNQNSEGEISLDDIYRSLCRICPQLEPYAEQIKQLEIQCELRFCMARKTGMALLEFARDMGKKVICVSDMYLSSKIIGQMLARCGYTDIDHIFISGEMGAHKRNGFLYRVVQKQLGCKPSDFIHIGDNLESDVKRAREFGWKSFYLPKVSDCMENKVPGYRFSSLFDNLYRRNSGIRMASNGFDSFFGMRCRLAVAANRLYDDPFVPFDPSSDFNANPAWIGYLAMGPYLLAIAQWLAELCRSESFDRLNFVARDGWLPIQAFESLKAIYGLEKLPTDYIYVSRKTMTPLLLATPECLTTIPWNNYNMFSFKPSQFASLVKNACSPEGIQRLKQAAAEQKIAWDAPFGSNANFEKFLALFMATCYDKEKALHYSKMVKDYYAPMFQGKTGCFDVGYSCRSDVVLKQLFGFDLTPCYLHINDEIADLRSLEAGLRYYTFYDYKPSATTPLREHIISYQGPSCTGFDCSGDRAVPVFEEYEEPFSAWYVTTQLQTAALQYVKDMVDIFGSALPRISARRSDASWPMEYFFHYPRAVDADLFNAIPFEDEMWNGGRVTIRDVWKADLNALVPRQIAPAKDDRLDYYAMRKPKKWLVWLLVDRKIMKDTAKRKLRHHPILLKISGGCYRALRSVSHLFRR